MNTMVSSANDEVGNRETPQGEEHENNNALQSHDVMLSFSIRRTWAPSVVLFLRTFCKTRIGLSLRCITGSTISLTGFVGNPE
jgi:hypothetical protein